MLFIGIYGGASDGAQAGQGTRRKAMGEEANVESRQWYYASGGEQVGPVSEERLIQLLESGQMEPQNLVWTQGFSNWVPASAVEGLVQPIGGLPPAPPVYGARPTARTGYAGFWRRFAAVFIDNVLLAIGGAILGGIFGLMLGIAMAASGASPVAIAGVAELIGYLIGLVLNWLYFTLFESSKMQATLGKMALGIIVTDMEGKRISFGRANGRYWAKIISAFILLIGYIMAAFTEKKQALHDIMASCLVVKK